MPRGPDSLSRPRPVGDGSAMKWAAGLRPLIWPAIATAVGIAAHTGYPAALAALNFPADSAALHQLTGAFGYFAAAWLGGRLVGIALERVGPKKRPVPKLLKELVTAVLFLVAAVATTMLVFGQTLSGVLAGSGILIAILGFALRNVIADVFSGVALGLEAPYRIGDAVDVEGLVRGRVIEIGWRTTRILTADSTYVILPNSQIAKLRLTNYSAPRRHYRTQVQVVVDHAVAAAEAKALLASAAAGTPGIMATPAPDVRVLSFSLEGIVYAVRFWVPAFSEEIDCRDAVLTAIDTALRERGFPPPHRKVRLALGGGRLDDAGEDGRLAAPGEGGPPDAVMRVAGG